MVGLIIQKNQVILRAIHKYNAEIIEFHLDLDKKRIQIWSLLASNEINQVIKLVNKGLVSDGNGKLLPSKSELNERLWRADPKDGLRPIKKIRNRILNNSFYYFFFLFPNLK